MSKGRLLRRMNEDAGARYYYLVKDAKCIKQLYIT